MDSTNEVTVICTPDQSEDIIAKYPSKNPQPLPSGNVILTYFDNDKEANFNTSVAISAAVTAYARIEMSEFLIKYPHNIYSIDTDGIKMDIDLDEKYLSKSELGKMKYEFTFDEAIFVAPKVYGGLIINKDTNEITELVKVKGLKAYVPYNDLKGVLYKDAFKIYKHEKFFREIGLSTIRVEEVDYKLKISTHKRIVIFDENGLFINTLPHKLKNGNFVSEQQINSEENE
jgi:hypothetical protein